MKFEMITPGQLDDYVGNSEALIIDLREPEEFVQRHIRGAVNIPYERFQERIMFPMDMELILYCERGSISISAARELSEKGYRVKTVVGGIHAYRGLNTVTDFNF
ncbi:MAG: rhodanese-like domain-containing protein [Marvinbryantia sp.]